MAYSDADKAKVCELVKRNKGIIDDVLVETVRNALGTPKLSRTNIWRWWKHYESMAVVPATNATEKKGKTSKDFVVGVPADDRELDVMLEDAARKFVSHALRDELLIWTSAKDAITAAAIAIDKMRLLRNLPTEIVSLLPDLLDALKASGADPVRVLQSLLERAKAVAAKNQDGLSKPN